MATNKSPEIFTEATLATITMQVMNHGLTREEIKRAKRSWTRDDVRRLATQVCDEQHAKLVDLVTDRVWAALERIDANRRAADPNNPMYRRLSGQ